MTYEFPKTYREGDHIKCAKCGSGFIKSVTTNAGIVHACEMCSLHWFVAYEAIPTRNTPPKPQEWWALVDGYILIRGYPIRADALAEQTQNTYVVHVREVLPE